jgi:hypothetical protein
MKEQVKNTKIDATPKIKIRKRVFLGEFKIEVYLRKEVELLLEKMKKNY